LLKSIKLNLFLLFLFLSSSLAHATVVRDLYQADVSVENRSVASWNAALPKALSQVFVKVTGDLDVATSGGLHSALSRAKNYVQRFSYQRDPQSGALTLHVNFDKKGINRLLSNSQKERWGRDRPLTVVWLAISTPDGKRYILSNDEQSSEVNMLNNTANSRGIPLLIPAMDLADLQAISVASVWQFDNTAIQQASNRYGADGFLVGRIAQLSEGEWQGACQLSLDDQTIQWTVNANSLDHVLEKLTNHLANELAAQYAITANAQDESTVPVVVSNVDGLASYTEVMSYLSKLSPVQTVDEAAIDNDVVVMTVHVKGGEQALVRAIARSRAHKLMPVSSDQFDEQNSNMALHYRWAEHRATT